MVNQINEIKVRVFKAREMPSVWEKDSLYFVLNGAYVETYFTDKVGVPKKVGNSQMIQDLSSSGGFIPTTLLNDYGFNDNSINWDEAFNWGDHATFGYLTSIPISYLQSGDNISGLVNDSGYITDYTVTEQDVTQYIGSLTYLHEQPIPSTLWSVNHNLGKFPSVTVVTTSGDEVEGCVNHINNNSLTITFSAGFSGKAFIN